MILSSPRSQTPTLATANIQFQNMITLAWGKIFSAHWQMDKLVVPPVASQHFMSIQVSPRQTPGDKYLSAPSPHKYIMDKWQWVIIPISLRNRCSYHVNDKSQLPGSALQSVVKRSELRRAWRAPAPVAAPYSAVVTGPLVQCTLIHFHSSQHSTAPLSLPSFILSTYTLIHL